MRALASPNTDIPVFEWVSSGVYCHPDFATLTPLLGSPSLPLTSADSHWGAGVGAYLSLLCSVRTIFLSTVNNLSLPILSFKLISNFY